MFLRRHRAGDGHPARPRQGAARRDPVRIHGTAGLVRRHRARPHELPAHEDPAGSPSNCTPCCSARTRSSSSPTTRRSWTWRAASCVNGSGWRAGLRTARSGRLPQLDPTPLGVGDPAEPADAPFHAGRTAERCTHQSRARVPWRSACHLGMRHPSSRALRRDRPRLGTQQQPTGLAVLDDARPAGPRLDRAHRRGDRGRARAVRRGPVPGRASTRRWS